MDCIPDGVIIINKPAGWTSQDVCSKLKGRLHIKKIGHTGTLDPMATGVLPICIGKATRIIEYYDLDRKSYHATMKLGVETDTLDITGEVLRTAPPEVLEAVTEERIRKAFEAYQGRITQIPPRYSAIWIDGRRAYDLARSGADFEIKGRVVDIFTNEVSTIKLDDPQNMIIEFDVTCSKGTYIRTICDDIGRALGCGGVMTALERTATGCFEIADARDIEEIASMSDEEILSLIIPMDETLTMLGEIRIADNRVVPFRNGHETDKSCFELVTGSQFGDMYKVYGKMPQSIESYGDEDAGHSFLGVGELVERSIIPRKVTI